ncbi:hypothetical protein BDF14DRAFT_1847920 [Spinellus fusiger]|nr:hypothetical protein BDF14DRAFT_1847920 [Spinellus fusiger]
MKKLFGKKKPNEKNPIMAHRVTHSSATVDRDTKGGFVTVPPQGLVASKSTETPREREKRIAQEASRYKKVNPGPPLVMPKPVYALAPTRNILRSYDTDKTEIESTRYTTRKSVDKDTRINETTLAMERTKRYSTGILYDSSTSFVSLHSGPVIVSRKRVMKNEKDSMHLPGTPSPRASIPNNQRILRLGHNRVSVIESEDSNPCYESALESPLSALELDPCDSIPTEISEGHQQRSSVLDTTPPIGYGSDKHPPTTDTTLFHPSTHSSCSIPSIHTYSARQMYTSKSQELLETKKRAHMNKLNLSRDPSPSHSSFPDPNYESSHAKQSEDIEALQRQVDEMQLEREEERKEWKEREMAHRMREQAMLDQITRTQDQLMMALSQSHLMSSPNVLVSDTLEEEKEVPTPRGHRQRAFNGSPDGLPLTPGYRPRRSTNPSMVSVNHGSRHKTEAEKPMNRSTRRVSSKRHSHTFLMPGEEGYFNYSSYNDYDEFEYLPPAPLSSNAPLSSVPVSSLSSKIHPNATRIGSGRNGGGHPVNKGPFLETPPSVSTSYRYPSDSLRQKKGAGRPRHSSVAFPPSHSNPPRSRSMECIWDQKRSGIEGPIEEVCSGPTEPKQSRSHHPAHKGGSLRLRSKKPSFSDRGQNRTNDMLPLPPPSTSASASGKRGGMGGGMDPLSHYPPSEYQDYEEVVHYDSLQPRYTPPTPVTFVQGSAIIYPDELEEEHWPSSWSNPSQGQEYPAGSLIRDGQEYWSYRQPYPPRREYAPRPRSSHYQRSPYLTQDMDAHDYY